MCFLLFAGTGGLATAAAERDDWLCRSSGKLEALDRLLPKLKRAGLRLLHLRRISVGPIALGGMVPGEVRATSQPPVGQSVRPSVGP